VPLFKLKQQQTRVMAAFLNPITKPAMQQVSAVFSVRQYLLFQLLRWLRVGVGSKNLIAPFAQ